MKRITWTEQNIRFGLNHCTKFGAHKDFTFDIRYDYDGDPKVKPDCGCALDIYFYGERIYSITGQSIDLLVDFSEGYLERTLNKLIKNV